MKSSARNSLKRLTSNATVPSRRPVRSHIEVTSGSASAFGRAVTPGDSSSRTCLDECRTIRFDDGTWYRDESKARQGLGTIEAARALGDLLRRLHGYDLRSVGHRHRRCASIEQDVDESDRR